MDEATIRQKLGERLRRLRERHHLGLAQVAASAGLPAERLERYEQGLSLPALGELMNLAQVFGVSLNHFFAAELSAARVEVVRAGERWKVGPQTETAAALNYRYEALSYRLTDKTMHPFYIEIPPDKGREVEPLSHEGEEFHFVLSGEVKIEIDRQTYQLAEGDAIYFDSRLPHTLQAKGFSPARLLACMVNVHRPPADDSPMQRAH